MVMLTDDAAACKTDGRKDMCKKAEKMA